MTDTTFRPQDPYEIIANLPRLVSLHKIAKRMGIPFKWARNALLKANTVQIYYVPGMPGQGLMVRAEDLDTVRDSIMVRINDPDNPLPAIDPEVIKEALKEDNE